LVGHEKIEQRRDQLTFFIIIEVNFIQGLEFIDNQNGFYSILVKLQEFGFHNFERIGAFFEDFLFHRGIDLKKTDIDIRRQGFLFFALGFNAEKGLKEIVVYMGKSFAEVHELDIHRCPPDLFQEFAEQVVLPEDLGHE
jgi:hypothetical protein